MKKSIQFNTEIEKQNIILENKTLILMEEQHHKDGNYLIFSDIKPLENQLVDLVDKQEAVKNLVMAVMSGVFDLYMK